MFASRDWHAGDHDNGGHFALDSEPDFVDTWPPHCVAGTPGAEYHPALSTEEVDVHIRKGQGIPAYSIFEGTDDAGETVSAVLTRHGITDIDVVGLATDYCVRASVLDALEHGQHVRVFTDLVAGVADDVVRGGAGRARARGRGDRGVERARCGRHRWGIRPGRRRPRRRGRRVKPAGATPVPTLYAESADGVLIGYRLRGEQPADASLPPVLLVHGFASNATVTWEGTGWVQALAEAGRAVITVDLRGHGDSDKPVDGESYAPELLGADLLAVLDSAGVEQVDVIGYSMGNRVTSALAELAPERIRRVVIGGAGPNELFASWDLDEVRAVLQRDEWAGHPLIEQVLRPAHRRRRRP